MLGGLTDGAKVMWKGGWGVQVSRVVLAWELLLLVLPITCLALFALAWLWQPAYHPDHRPMQVALVLALIGLTGFWRVVIAFYRGGWRVHAAPAWARVCTAAGAGLSVAGLVAALFHRPTGWAYIGVMGAPVLLPLLHLLLISRRASARSKLP